MKEIELTRAYLNQLKAIDKRIRFKLEEAEKWRSIAENHSSHISDVKVQTSKKEDKMAEAITNALQYEQESYDLANKLIALKKHIICQIESMEEKDYLILYLFFIQGKTYKDIGRELDISNNGVKGSLKEAVRKFSVKFAQEIALYGEKIGEKSHTFTPKYP